MKPHIAQRCRRITESPTLAISAKAAQMRAEGHDVIGFGAGEPDFDTPQNIIDAASEALHGGKTHYTPSSGILPLRQAICDKLKKDNGIEYSPDQVIVSNGAKHTLFNIFQAILNPGDEVLIPSPCWVSYPEMVRMAEGVPVFVPATEAQGFKPSVEQLRAHTTDRTVAMILNSPSNPTGQVMSREELRAVADFATQAGIYVVSDEIYEKLIYDGAEHISIASLGEDIHAQTLTVNGLSKAYAMTGWRIGYAAGPREVISAMNNFQSHATSNPNSIAQYASLEALTGDQSTVETMRGQFDLRRRELVSRINAVDGLSALMPEGAFYVMMNVSGVFGRRYQGKPITGSVDFSKYLLEGAKVAVVPGIAFEDDNYVRLSYATGMDSIIRGMERIEEFVQKLGNIPAREAM